MPLGVSHGGGNLHGAVFVEGDEARIEEGIKLGGEEKAVEGVEALGVRGAVGPGFGVAGAEEFGDVEAGNGAGAAPVFHQGFAEQVLAHTTFGQGQCLSGAGWVGLDFGDLGSEEVGRVGGQRLGQLGGSAEKLAQFKISFCLEVISDWGGLGVEKS